jgi:putative ABC transport system permease protein
MALDRLAWRALAARPLRSLLTIVGTALGVGVLAASLTLGAALDAAVDRTVRTMVGRADLRVSGFLEPGLSPAAVEVIVTTPGVLEASQVIERRTFLASVPGAGAANAVTVLGIDPASFPRLHDLELVAGSGLAATDEAVAIITEELAASDGYGLGSQLSVLGPGGPTTVRVVGIAAGPGPLPQVGRTIVLPLDTARSALGLVGATRVDVSLEPGSADAVVAALSLRMSEPYVVASPVDLARNLRASAAAFQGTAALVAAVVLFVGAFLIVNTLSMTVGERAREVGLLRAAGATRTQAGRFVLSGALMLGVSGALAGVLIGGVLAVLMAATVSTATGLPTVVAAIDLRSAAVAAGVGVTVAALAAVEPALRAAQISPVEALRARFDLPHLSRSRLWWIGVVFVVVGGLALIAWPPSLAATPADITGALAVYLVLLVATLLSPILLRPLARLLGLPLGLLFRVEERLARDSVARDRSRAALTLGSLVVGLAMIVALGWSAQAARSSAFAWLEDVVPGDELVSSIRPVAPDEGIVEALAGVPGVERVTPIAAFGIAYQGHRVDATAIDGADFVADGRLTSVAGDRASALRALDDGGAVILPQAVAAALGLGLDDTMRVATGRDEFLDLRVVAIVERSIPGTAGESALVGWPDAIESLGVEGADAFAVRFVPAASSVERTALRETAATFALEANPIERIQGAVAEALARVFGVFDALALVAVLIAALGIINTLTIGVVERVREIGVLRAIGMTRAQIMRMVVVEAGVLGIVGFVLGSAAGLAVGGVMLGLGGRLDPTAGLPWPAIGAAAALGLVLPALAALYPSLLAARVSIVEALHFE